MDALQIAARHGIRIHSSRGSQKTVCPQCSHKRTHKDDRCLSVRIDNTGIGWRCFNCGWSGGELNDNVRGSAFKMAGKAGDQSGRGGAYGSLLRKARGEWVMHSKR